MPLPDRGPLVIAGGGLAGLSLAVRLSRLGFTRGRRVIVLESRSHYEHDRTWCFWARRGAVPDSLAAGRWPRWRVSGHEGQVTREAPGYEYVQVNSEGFYALAGERLRRDPNVDLRMGMRVEAIEPGPRVCLANGEVLDAAFVADGRPPDREQLLRHTGPAFLQHFAAFRVGTSRLVFDPRCVDLMDFRVPQPPGGVRFAYALPHSETGALVYDTWMTPTREGLRSSAEYEDGVRTWLNGRAAGYSEVAFAETGVIPMMPGIRAPASPPGVISIGTRSGAVKPSTGYGFVFIRRQTHQIAEILARGVIPRPLPPRGAGRDVLDRIFLRVLQDRPNEAPRLFCRLFARANSPAVVKFLQETGGLPDDAAVMAAMPKIPFLRAAVRTLRSRQ